MENTRWRIVELGGVAVTGEDNYLIFDSTEGRVQTSLGCNSISLPYKIMNGLQIKIEDCASTFKACPEPDREAELIKALLEVDNVSISGTTLTLNRAKMAPLVRLELSTEDTTVTDVTDAVAPVYDGAPAIEGTTWQLVQLGGRDVNATPESHMLRLEDGQLSAIAGCNRMRASYTTDGGSLTIGDVVATRMACPDMTDEQELAKALSRTKNFKLFAGNLTLMDGETDLARFTPVP